MTLPLADSPWLLSPDDVFGYRLANVRLQRFADTREAIGVEHANGESGAGEHDSVQIVRAVHVFRMPKYDPLSDLFGATPSFEWGYSSDQALNAYGPTVGWTIAPVLRHASVSEGGAPETQYFIDCVPAGLLFGSGFCPVWDAVPAFDYAKMHTMLARRCVVDSTVGGTSSGAGVGGVPIYSRSRALRIWLGNWNAIKDLKGGTIVAHVAVQKEV